ncbi:hypothetical protein GCM10027614_78630 [Micromonospora vulcania]
MFWDIVGVGTLLDEILTWLAQRVADVIEALWSLLSSAFLVVPDVTGLPQVETISARALMIVNTCFVLAIIASNVVIMSRDSVQARYGVGELVPRLVIGFIAANFATPLSKGLIELGNALTQALTSDPITTEGSLGQMKRTVVDALTDPANALLTLIIGIAIAALVAMIMVGWILRLGLLVILVGIAPVALASHATPWTESAAKLWWRAFIGALATVIAQALALHTALTVFLSPTANLPALGLPDDPTGTFNLFIICCLLLAVVKIPALMRRYVTGGQSNNVVGAFIRVAIVQQVSRALTGACGAVADRPAGQRREWPPARLAQGDRGPAHRCRDRLAADLGRDRFRAGPRRRRHPPLRSVLYREFRPGGPRPPRCPNACPAGVGGGPTPTPAPAGRRTPRPRACAGRIGHRMGPEPRRHRSGQVRRQPTPRAVRAGRRRRRMARGPPARQRQRDPGPPTLCHRLHPPDCRPGATAAMTACPADTPRPSPTDCLRRPHV